MLNVCLTQARAFAARDMLAVLYGVEGLNVILAPEQLQVLQSCSATQSRHLACKLAHGLLQTVQDLCAAHMLALLTSWPC